MQLNGLDWLVVVVSLLAAFAPALFLARRASQGTAEFFASGRSAPWWLIGTSMVATTFSTDTPNLVTNFVRDGGVAKNWSWWAFLLTGMMTVFFYARLWRRSGALTDLEFYELRYGGTAAAVVRGFRAIYLGFFFNCFIMATVTLAAVKIANIMLGWERFQTLLVCGAICILFSTLSGLWGVMAADLVQFAIAMIGVFAAAWYALDQPQVGGLAGLVEKIDPNTLRLLPALHGPGPDGAASTLNWDVLVPILILPLAVQWWSVWYPGAEPGGGSYVAQRMLAAKDERHAVTATLWFNVAHYALRPWPWIVVALCSILVYPSLADIQAAFPHIDGSLLGNDIAYPAMLTLLPHGLLGLLVASLLSAYVSTMSTHLNWGASYLVNDFYRRFVLSRTGQAADERHLVWVSRCVTAGLMVAAAAFVYLLDTAAEGFQVLISVGAGTGLIYLLRWFWWRVNAWSEIAGMGCSFVIAMVVLFVKKQGYSISDTEALLWSVGSTTTAWVLVTFFTRPTPREKLIRFYRLVRPAGPGWRRIRTEAGVGPSPDSLTHALLGWVCGCAGVYSALFGVGGLLYGDRATAVACGVVFVVSAAVVTRLLARMWGRTLAERP